MSTNICIHGQIGARTAQKQHGAWSARASHDAVAAAAAEQSECTHARDENALYCEINYKLLIDNIKVNA